MADREPHTPDDNASDSPGDALATMNEHLARFFEHADTLLAEWKAYGESLRANLDAQARALEETMTQAVERAGREAASAIDAHLEQATRASLDRLRQELDALSEQARTSGESRPRARADTRDPEHSVSVHHDPPTRSRVWHSGAVLLGLTVANVILAALLVSSIRSCRGNVYEHRPGSGWDTPTTESGQTSDLVPDHPIDNILPDGRDADASSGETGDASSAGAATTGPTPAQLCATLSQGYDPMAARAFIGASATKLCADEASALGVTEALISNLPASPSEDESEDKPGKDGEGAGGKDADAKRSSGKSSGKRERAAKERKK